MVGNRIRKNRSPDSDLEGSDDEEQYDPKNVLLNSKTRSKTKKIASFGPGSSDRKYTSPAGTVKSGGVTSRRLKGGKSTNRSRRSKVREQEKLMSS